MHPVQANGSISTCPLPAPTRAGVTDCNCASKGKGSTGWVLEGRCQVVGVNSGLWIEGYLSPSQGHVRRSWGQPGASFRPARPSFDYGPPQTAEELVELRDSSLSHVDAARGSAILQPPQSTRLARPQIGPADGV